MGSAREIRGLAITAIERLRLSANGNPAYRITFDSGLVARTQADAAISYGITNAEYRGTLVTVSLSAAGRITDVRVCGCHSCKRDRGERTPAGELACSDAACHEHGA